MLITGVVMLVLTFASVMEANAGPWGRHGGGYRGGYGRGGVRVVLVPPIPRVIIRPPVPIVRVNPGYGYNNGYYHRSRGCYRPQRSYGRRYY